jgi:hypothetical protein
LPLVGDHADRDSRDVLHEFEIENASSDREKVKKLGDVAVRVGVKVPTAAYPLVVDTPITVARAGGTGAVAARGALPRLCPPRFLPRSLLVTVV